MPLEEWYLFLFAALPALVRAALGILDLLSHCHERSLGEPFVVMRCMRIGVTRLGFPVRLRGPLVSSISVPTASLDFLVGMRPRRTKFL